MGTVLGGELLDIEEFRKELLLILKKKEQRMGNE